MGIEEGIPKKAYITGAKSLPFCQKGPSLSSNFRKERIAQESPRPGVLAHSLGREASVASIACRLATYSNMGTDTKPGMKGKLSHSPTQVLERTNRPKFKRT